MGREAVPMAWTGLHQCVCPLQHSDILLYICRCSDFIQFHVCWSDFDNVHRAHHCQEVFCVLRVEIRVTFCSINVGVFLLTLLFFKFRYKNLKQFV